MSNALTGENAFTNANVLSWNWRIGLLAAFCIYVPLFGSLAQEVGGWGGWGLWCVAWLVMAVAAGFVCYKYADHNLLITCAVLVGITSPRPSSEGIRQLIGEGVLSRSSEIIISIVSIMIVYRILLAIAKANKPAPAAATTKPGESS